MTVSTTDARAKYVSDKLIDKVSTSYQLRNIFTPIGEDGPMRKGESIDIPTRSAITVSQVSSGSTSNTLSVQANTPTANNLVVDQHYGAIVAIPKLQSIFDMEGSWSSQMADQVLTEIGDNMDIDLYDDLIRVGAYDSSASYWANVAGDAISNDDLENALAIMTSQRGVRYENLVFAFHPYGMGSVRRLSAFIPNYQRAEDGNLGLPMIGTVHGVPVVVSQSVKTSMTQACTAVSISSNVATVTVAAGHGFVPGMLITIAGITTPLTVAAAITAVSATTLTVPLTASDGAMADGAGTVTWARCANALVHRPWAFRRVQLVPDLRIVPRITEIDDVLQADALWGVKVLTGSCVGIASPAAAVA